MRSWELWNECCILIKVVFLFLSDFNEQEEIYGVKNHPVYDGGLKGGIQSLVKALSRLLSVVIGNTN